MRIPLAWALVGIGTLASAADLDDVKARGALRVVVAEDEAAETFALQPGPDPGFERELLESFARLSGVKLEVVSARGYADRIPILTRGDGDVIVAIFDTEDRRKLVDFTAEVMPTHNVVVTVQPRPRVANLDELRKLKVGVIEGTQPAHAAVESGGVPPYSVPPFDTLAQ